MGMKLLVNSRVQIRWRRITVCSHADGFLQSHMFCDRGSAVAAAIEMSGHLFLRCALQLIVHEQRDFFPPLAIHGFAPTDLFPSDLCPICFPPSAFAMFCRSIFLALANLDITVPMGITSASAIS